VLEQQTALADVLQSSGRDGSDGQRRVCIGEVRDWTLLELAGFPTLEDELACALRSHLGMDPPARVGVAETLRGLQWFRTGAARFWIVAGSRDAALENLASVLAPTLCASIGLSQSRTCIFIEGAAARDVLARGIAIDLHPDVFGIDHYALTALQGTPVMVHRSCAGRFHLYVMRSYALTIWEWLTDAAWPFGYDIAQRLL
jgi:heterotetrameric sarcosine oxidase gamma subunit